MRKIVVLVYLLFVVSIISFAQKQKDYQIRFKNGQQYTVQVLNEEPLLIPRGNLLIGIFKLGLVEEGGLFGPFNADITYQRLLKDNKAVVEGNLYFTPIDSRYFELDPDVRVFNFNGSLIYKRYLLREKALNKKRINYISDYNSNYGGPVIYRAKLPVSFERRYGLRGGLYMNQNSLVTNEKNIPGGNEYVEAQAQKNISLFAGISRARFINFHYYSTTFGQQKINIIGEMYLDVIVSPWISLYGTHSLQNPSSYITMAKGKLNSKYSNLIDKEHVGVRLGGICRTAWIRRDRVGHYFSYEFAYYPGVVKNNIVISGGFGIVIFGKNRSDID